MTDSQDTQDTIPAEVVASIVAISKPDVNSKVAFQRRMANLEAYVITEINPLEMSIIDLREKLIPLYDKMNELREDARAHCTHPIDLIMHVEGDLYKCRFCETSFHVDV